MCPSEYSFPYVLWQPNSALNLWWVWGRRNIPSPPPAGVNLYFLLVQNTGPRMFSSHPPGKISFVSTLPTEAMGLCLVLRGSKEDFLPNPQVLGGGGKNVCCPSSSSLRLLFFMRGGSTEAGSVLCLFLRVTSSPLQSCAIEEACSHLLPCAYSFS